MERQTAEILAVLEVAILAALLLPVQTAAKDKRPPEKLGIIAGTVFQESGLSLRGATVTVTPAPGERSQVNRKDVKSAVSDSRGEFAVRVPGGSMRYTVRVEAEGWQPAEKTVVVQWEERVDVFFRLKPEGTSK